jgi:hypothetical protein
VTVFVASKRHQLHDSRSVDFAVLLGARQCVLHDKLIVMVPMLLGAGIVRFDLYRSRMWDALYVSESFLRDRCRTLPKTRAS